MAFFHQPLNVKYHWTYHLTILIPPPPPFHGVILLEAAYVKLP